MAFMSETADRMSCLGLVRAARSQSMSMRTTCGCSSASGLANTLGGHRTAMGTPAQCQDAELRTSISSTVVELVELTLSLTCAVRVLVTPR